MKHVLIEVKVHTDEMLPRFVDAIADAIRAGKPARVSTRAGTAEMRPAHVSPIGILLERGRCTREVLRLQTAIQDRKARAIREREIAHAAMRPADNYLRDIQLLTSLEAEVSAAICEIEEPEMAKA